MDRPVRRLPKGHHLHHQQRRSQSQHIVPGGATSTESENEDGNAVYESLTTANKGRTSFKGSELSAVPGLARRQPVISDLIPITNLDTAPRTSNNNRKDYSKSQLYELIRLSSETGSPETDDVISENSEGNRVSECPTVAVNGGSYSVPSEVSCNHHHHPSSQYGVQQLSAQNLQNLTSHRYHRESNAIYFTTTDLDDGCYLDKHASASSPTTSSSDRCLLPTSSGVNICKVSNKHCGGIISTTSTASDRHLFRPGPSMSHPTDLIARHTLSEHYLANTIRRSGQCPIHTDGMLTNLRNHLRPPSTVKPVRESSKFRNIFTWRNAALLMGLIIIALIGALVYYVVSMGKSRYEEPRAPRDQNVISNSQVFGESASSITSKERYKRSYEKNITEDNDMAVDLRGVSNETLGNETYPVWEYEPSITFPGENQTPTYNVVTNEQATRSIAVSSTTEPITLPPTVSKEENETKSKETEQVTFTITKKTGSVEATKTHRKTDVMQSDQPTTDSEDTTHTFSVLQTFVLMFRVDEKGRSMPTILLKDSQILKSSESGIAPRAQRDVKNNESWNDGDEEQGFPYNVKSVYPTEDQIIALQLGSSAEVTVPGQGFWIARLIQRTDGFVSLNVSTSNSASFVLYGNRDVPPKHSHYDFVRLVQPSRLEKKSADQENNVKVFREKLDAGVWFIGIYNDQEVEQKLTFSVLVPENFCPNDCSQHGTCLEGKCLCADGSGGDDCSQVVCPLVCSGHGQYSQGTCHCVSGWKGAECEIPQFQCESPNCNSRGKCINGKCACVEGYSGENCEIVECPKECLTYGACINGTCFCQPGWQGLLCQTAVNDARQLCSNHGSFDPITKKCVCDHSWSGESCSIEMCQPSCSSKGKCSNQLCVCDPGFSGPTCEQKQCPNCGPNGSCQNGTCKCERGFFGRLCSANGCPDDCSGHGICNKTTAVWKCQCQPGWKGDNCTIPMEINCSDGKDNDGDKLIDCEDPDCCQSDSCIEHANCVASPEPREVLLKEQASADTASFFEKVRFLIRENGVQNFADRSAFDQKRVSVLRGKVVDSNGIGLVGVRVSVQTLNGSTSPWGFTISRKDGMFDLLLNGGSSSVIVFQKGGFRQTTSTVYLSWNEFSSVDPVKMYRETETTRNRVNFIPSGVDDAVTCDLFSPKPDPEFYPYWNHFSIGGKTSGSAVYYEAQVLQESLNITGVDLVINHFSSRTNGFYSLLLVTLTDDTIAEGLNRVTFRISNAGTQEEVVYDATTNLSHLYAWNGFNSYKQQVFGFSRAKVSIGYESKNCKELLWIHKTVMLKGMDLSISDIGGWDFSIHHRYNTDGILHRGDGLNVLLSQGQLEVTAVAGDGNIRPVTCENGCSSGLGTATSFISPIAVVSGSDGSLYIGDFNYIYRVRPDGSVTPVLELQSPAMLQKYFMAVNPYNGQVYVSLPQSLKVIRILSLEAPTDPSNNFEVVVGSGAHCLPQFGQFDCGDGHSATLASMIFPKGITFDKYGSLFVVDGASIRVVDTHGSISTLISQGPYQETWTPGPNFCSEVTDFSKLSLRWPTSISVNPVDEHVYLLDGAHVIQLNLLHRKATLILGKDCEKSSEVGSIMPISMDVSPSGVIMVLESNLKDWRIRELNGKSNKVILSSCNSSACQIIPTSKASDAIVLPVDIATSSDGNLYVSDCKALKVFRVAPALPKLSSNSLYEIEDRARNELYTFNEFGQHLRTNDLLTKVPVYEFSYTADTAFGKLQSISAEGRTVNLQRDYRNSVRSLESGNGWKISITNTIRGLLKDATYNSGYQVNFGYESETGLISGKSDSAGKSFNYQYDKFGRLTQVIFPTGGRMSLQSTDPSTLTVIESDNALIQSSNVLALTESKVRDNGWFQSLLLSATGNGSFKVDLAVQNRSHSIRKNFKVNGNTVLSLDFAPTSNEEILSDSDGVPVFMSKMDGAFRPSATRVLVGDFAPTNFTYDSTGKLVKWTQASRFVIANYNQQGLLSGTKLPNGATWKYDHNDKRQLVKVTKGSGTVIELDYDMVGGLSSVSSPKGEKWTLIDENLLLFRRLSIRSAQQDVGFSIDLNSQNQIIAKNYPSGSKGIHVINDQDGRVTGIFGGRTSFTFSYKEDQLDKISSSSEILTSLTEKTYWENSLLKSETSSFSGVVQLDNVAVTFEYDNNFNVVRRKVQVGNKDLSLTDIQYNVKTTQPRKVGPFSISQSQIGAMIVSDDNAIFLRQLNNMAKTRNFVLRLQQRVVGSLEISYTDMGQLGELKLRKRDSDAQLGFAFKYDLDGQLIEATKNRQPWYSYSYDLNGNMFSISAVGVARILNFTTGDRLSGMMVGGKEILINSDLDGFVTRKGDLKLNFNSFGLLDRVSKVDSSLDIKYMYDHQNRLIARYSATENLVTQYVYGGEDMRITHVFHKKTLIQFHYDTLNQLVAMSRDAVIFYIIQSPMSTVIVDSQGQTTKEIMWSPFGELLSDSTPEFYYPFDQRSRIRDVSAGLTFHEESRVYDPEIGRFLAPDFRDLRQFSLKSLNPYKFQDNDPLLAADEKSPLLRMEDWIGLLGIPAVLESALSKLNLDKNCQQASSLTIVNNMCLPDHVLDRYQMRSFSENPRSATIPDLLAQAIRISSVLPFYNKGVVFSPSTNQLRVYRTGTGSRIMNEALETLFDNVKISPWTVSGGSLVKIFAAKPGTSATLELDASRLQSAVPNLNLTKVHQSSSLLIQSGSLVFNMTYFANIETSLELIKNFVTQQTVIKSWMFEKSLIDSGESGLLWKWNDNEKSLLSNSRSVPGFRGYLLRDPMVFPQLANDLFNVALTRS